MAAGLLRRERRTLVSPLPPGECVARLRSFLAPEPDGYPPSLAGQVAPDGFALRRAGSGRGVGEVRGVFADADGHTRVSVSLGPSAGGMASLGIGPVIGVVTAIAFPLDALTHVLAAACVLGFPALVVAQARAEIHDVLDRVQRVLEAKDEGIG